MNLVSALDEIEPLLWTSRRPQYESAWHGHVPFAHWIVSVASPSIIVELGTHNAVSYMAFCHAVAMLQLPTKCFGVDIWTGDAHAGFYGENIYSDVLDYNKHYSHFSNLLRMTFDEAVPLFQDRCIDILHIDGLHTYDAVRHDFETWRPKLSDKGIVLLHDIEITNRGFGVWRLWEELRTQYPSFGFSHSAGLGVLAVGPNVPAKVLSLCCTTASADIHRLSSRMAALADMARRVQSSGDYGAPRPSN